MSVMRFWTEMVKTKHGRDEARTRKLVTSITKYLKSGEVKVIYRGQYNSLHSL